MIATLCPYIVRTMKQAGRLHALLTETLLANSCLGWTLVAVQTPFTSICNQHLFIGHASTCVHWHCVLVCVQAFHNDANIPPPHPPPPSTLLPRSQLQLDTSQPKSTKRTRFFTSLFPPKSVGCLLAARWVPKKLIAVNLS